MLRKLIKLMKEIGIVQLTNELNYRSTQTVRNWIKKKTIPELAKVRVKTVFKKRGIK